MQRTPLADHLRTLNADEQAEFLASTAVQHIGENLGIQIPSWMDLESYEPMREAFLLFREDLLNLGLSKILEAPRA